MEGTPTTNRTLGKNPLLMRRQSKTCIYHRGCVDMRPVSVEMTEGKRASEGQQTMLRELCLRRLAYSRGRPGYPHCPQSKSSCTSRNTRITLYWIVCRPRYPATCYHSDLALCYRVKLPPEHSAVHQIRRKVWLE